MHRYFSISVSAETVKGVMREILSQDFKNVCLMSFIAFGQIFMHHQNLHIVIKSTLRAPVPTGTFIMQLQKATKGFCLRNYVHSRSYDLINLQSVIFLKVSTESFSAHQCTSTASKFWRKWGSSAFIKKKKKSHGKNWGHWRERY